MRYVGRSRPGRATRDSERTDGRPSHSGDSSLDLSTDSDSDDLFLDKDEPELAHSDDDESLGLELSGMERHGPSGRKTGNRMQSNSDEDF